MVPVGRIIRPQHNRGEVLVVSETDFAEERFAVGSRLYCERHEGQVETMTVATTRNQDGRWIVRFEGVESINDAETLRGLDVRLPADELKPLGAGAFYVHDLVGCQVRTLTGTDVGAVVRVDVGVGIPMLVIDGDGEVLVPFVDHICRRVDLDARVIEIEPVPGLLELNRPVRR
jgi:16S rRNA processing protein RimM